MSFIGLIFLQTQKESNSQKELEREAALKHSLEELESKNKAVLLREEQVKELEQKLQLAETKSKEKVCIQTTPSHPAPSYICMYYL